MFRGIEMSSFRKNVLYFITSIYLCCLCLVQEFVSYVELNIVCIEDLTLKRLVSFLNGQSVNDITDWLFILQDSSGLVISIIVVINRVSIGAMVIGIQSFYPEKE